jgi:hypothetical protein
VSEYQREERIAWIKRMLAEHVGLYDVEAINRGILDLHGAYRPISAIPGNEFWAIARSCKKPKKKT